MILPLFVFVFYILLFFSFSSFFVCYFANDSVYWFSYLEGRKCFIERRTQHILFTVIWLRTILIVREETRCRHVVYSFRLAARVLLYAPSHRQDTTYHGFCYTSRGALVGTRNSSMGKNVKACHCKLSHRVVLRSNVNASNVTSKKNNRDDIKKQLLTSVILKTNYLTRRYDISNTVTSFVR